MTLKSPSRSRIARGLKKAVLRLVLDVRERVTGMGRCGESGNKGVFLL
jgi:hypothetical protein